MNNCTDIYYNVFVVYQLINIKIRRDIIGNMREIENFSRMVNAKSFLINTEGPLFTPINQSIHGRSSDTDQKNSAKPRELFSGGLSIFKLFIR